MANFYYQKVWFYYGFQMLLFLLMIENSEAQNFSQNSIDFNGKGTIASGTSLMFGPDNRLYVAQYSGKIKILTLDRRGPGDYVVLHMETLDDIQNIQDHNDDGTKYSSNDRETIGLTVVGTATHPVIYVTSSDYRIGGGGGGGSGDVGLDTNSGIITRFSWNGSSWDVVDIVRGLPRSEENHATNGLEFVTIKGIDYLIVAQGGHTNAGSASQNFAYTTEYALSAAVLSINLTAIEAMPIRDDNGRKFIYDIPTLDDPTRPNVNGIIDPDDPGYDGIDVNDPFGGNDGLNQAMIVPGGPVQIFSPGYRNAYDLVVTESQALYVTDNGANGGWGGFPVNEGGGLANNDYDPAEPGSSIATSDGEKINNKDHLSLVTLDIQNYSFGSFYGGHPTPVRANPQGAGLYTNPAVTGTLGAVYRTLIYHPTKNSNGYTTNPNLGLPANWPPVATGNPVEGDWRGPGLDNPDGPNDELVTTWGTNTNGIDEYTASNFEGAMKGNLIAGVNTGELRRVELNPDGSLKKLTPSFVSGLGGNALGITCNGDTEIFPGTIWVVTLSGKLIVLEPQDFGICVQPGESGYDPEADNDNDGYSNKDEVDSGTDPCNGGSQPNDFDKSAGGILVSDLNDLDDDNDGIPDSDDPFQLGDPEKEGSDAFTLPVINELFSSNPELKGYMGLGMTGLMNNGDPNPNWLKWLDRRDDPNDPNPNDILGGAIGAMTMQMTSGTALGTGNTQEKGFQYGVQVDQSTGSFTVAGNLVNFHAPLQLYGDFTSPGAELGFFIGDGTQSNYIKFVLTRSGITAQQEIEDIPQAPLSLEIPFNERPSAGVNLYFVVDPSSGIVAMEFSFDNGQRRVLGTVNAQGAVLEAIQQAGKDLAVGFIGTSNAAGVEVEGTWDFLNVISGKPVVAQVLPNLERIIGSADEDFDLNQYFYDDQGVANLDYTIEENTNSSIAAVIVENKLALSYPTVPAISQVTIRATDVDANFVEQQFTITVNEAAPSLVLFRVNSGGPAITAIDGGLDWGADTAEQNSPYLSEPARNKTYSGSMSGYTEDVDQTTTPKNIYNYERYDSRAGAPNLTYSFPVPVPGKYEVRLYMGNAHINTSLPGSRIFDVAIEGIVYPALDDLDLSATYGYQIGTVITHTVEVNDGLLDISFIHGSIENPLINGIEILGSSNLGTPIQLTKIPDQTNSEGDELDGSLVVSATGGDGKLSYSISGQPEGITIEPTNGQIGGSIAAGAAAISPYTVTVSVDDNDDHTSDARKTSFIWTVTTGEPAITQQFLDLKRAIGAEDETFDLHEYFDDDKGREQLAYSITENTNAEIQAIISGNLLTLSYPDAPAKSNITIRATDSDSRFVEQTFEVIVADSPASIVLFRVNSGGPAIAAIDGGISWGADTAEANSPYLSEPGRNKTYSGSMTGYTSTVDQTTTPVSIYTSERYDSRAGAPNMTYSFPVAEPGNYEVRLYMGNGHINTSLPGARIFDVEIEGIIYPDLDDLDLAATFGHQIGAVVTHTVNVTDGSIDISFLHGVENPLINGIEILGSSDEAPVQLAPIADQFNYAGEELSGTLIALASGGVGDLKFSMTGAPEGVSIDAVSGVISGIIASNAAANSPYTVEVKVEDSREGTVNSANTTFKWTVTTEGVYVWEDKNENEAYTARHECSFVQAGDRFYLMGGRESAKTVDVYDYKSNTWISLIDSAPVEFNHYQATEYQGLIWIIGAFKTNNYPSEIPAEFIWIFDPANRIWIQGPEIPLSRQRGSAGLVVYNDKFYITGGNTKGHDGGYVAWFDEYDPATGIWKTLADAPRARDHFHAAVIGNKMYAAGGRLTGGSGGTFKPVIAEVDVYDFTSQTWSTLPAAANLPTPRAAASVVNFKDKLLVVGGEVENELVYGVNMNDALRITEEYDPVTGSWTRLADLNYERHGTQAIVSGEGVFILAGSPNRGGGRQKNMEYMGLDAPVGDAAIASSLSAPQKVQFEKSTEIALEVKNGNVGVIINSIEITGTAENNFKISTGGLTNALLKPNSAHTIELEYMGSTSGEVASLVVNFGGGQTIIGLESVTTASSIEIVQLTDQTNVEGDVLDGSLAISATGGEGDLQFSATGAPPGVVIDSATGVISGTIAQDADLGSPYSVSITVDDSDEQTDDAVTIIFTWTILSGEPVIAEEMPDLVRYINAASENIVLDSYFNDNDGVENLVYTIAGNTNTAVGTVIKNNVLALSYPATPAESNITIRATDAGGKYAEQTFLVSVTYDPAGTPIEVVQIAPQESYAGNELDGTLAVSATGGDGTLKYSMTGSPAGVQIDIATGVITGIIDGDAADLSPYNVIIAVDDSDDHSTDAVTESFTWTILSGEPVIAQEIPDLERIISSADETIDLNLYFSDNDGVENLTYTVEGNTNAVIAASIADNFLTLSYPSSPATTDITVRATDGNGNLVEQTFSVNVIYNPEGTPIDVTAIASQENVVGDVLDGSLIVVATGGDGALVYSLNGAPASLSIDPATGAINGTIAMDADVDSPYNVIVTVDDSDDHSTDAVTESFTWTILSGEPVIAQEMPDLERIISSADETIDLNLYFSDNDGVENLTYTVEGNTDAVIAASITDNLLTLSYPSSTATTDITVRATDMNDNFVEQTFTVDVIYDPAGTPINLTAIAPQENYVDDILDGNLAFEATGGDGELVYSMWGAPSGVAINAATGMISGTIAADADVSSPYDVTITVDDSDSETADAVSESFTWTILSGTPVITEVLPDLERYAGSATEIFELDTYFDDNTGVAGLVYTITENSNSLAIGAVISGNELVITYPNSPASSTLRVRATDVGGRFVEQEFSINVIKIPLVLHRINAGGAGIASIDAEKDWEADTAAENSPYLIEAGTNTVAGYSMTGYSSGVDLTTTPTGIFTSERSDETFGAPNMAYSLPVPKAGTYEVRLYFGNGHQGNSRPGRQIFDVELEGIIYPEFDNLDITALFGHQTGGVISRELQISDGSIDISFIHGAKKNPMINGIEIITVSVPGEPIQLTHISDQQNVAGDVLDGFLMASATGGDGKLIYSMSGAPAGININASTGQISGIIDQYAEMGSPYSVVVSVDDSDVSSDDAVQTGFMWLVTSGVPVVVLEIPDLQRLVNTEDEVLVLSDYFDDNEGVENLEFSMAGNTGTTIQAVVLENVLTLSYPPEPAVAEITVRATDLNGKFVEQTFSVTVLEEAAGSDIQVAQITDQTGYAGEPTDGSLIVLASGGDGTLRYSLQGAPLGISINSSSGEISGTIDINAAAENPYEVTVNVDDSDEVSNDAVSATFLWNVLDGIPVVVQELPDIERYTGDSAETIDLSAYFDDNGGVENLDFTVQANSDLQVVATIIGNYLTLSYPEVAAFAEISINATDQFSKTVNQSFTVTVLEEPESGSPILYRVNSGGPTIAAIDGEMAWAGDSATEPSLYLTEAGTNTIAGYLMTSYSSNVDLTTTPTGIFSSERSDTGGGAPNMTYSFPVSEAGNYEIRLYFGSGHQGNSRPGRQIFDVEIEGVISPQLNDVDLAAIFGHQVGGVIIQTLQVTDGAIDISFLHGPKKNPMINGIEIIKKANTIEVQLTGGDLSQKSAEELDLSGIKPMARLYPNPGIYDVYLEISDIAVELNEIYLYSYEGRLAQRFFANQVEERKGLYKLDVSGLPDGVYLVKFDSNIGTHSPLRLVIKK